MSAAPPPAEGALAELVRRLPKVELHVHLEGAIAPATLLDLAHRRGVALPADDEQGLARWFRFRDFDHFIEIYLACSACLVEPEDFHRVARDFLAAQGRQNVVYSEVHFTISTHLARAGLTGAAARRRGEAIHQALVEAAIEGEARWGTRLALIPDIVRNLDRERADATVEWALAGRGAAAAPVVALGISGKEAGLAHTPFREHFAAAAGAGLRRVAHAGEHGGPESVRSALDELGAERIGHGVRAAEDPELVAELVRRQVPLEVSPSSNVSLGVVPSLAEHPFDRLYRAGVAVTVNSDDPPLFGTTLCTEYLRLAETFGYGPAELAGLAGAAIRASFLPAAEQRRLEHELRATAAAAGEELFGRPIEPVGC